MTIRGARNSIRPLKITSECLHVVTSVQQVHQTTNSCGSQRSRRSNTKQWSHTSRPMQANSFASRSKVLLLAALKKSWVMTTLVMQWLDNKISSEPRTWCCTNIFCCLHILKGKRQVGFVSWAIWWLACSRSIELLRHSSVLSVF